jgi:hypothetical protein
MNGDNANLPLALLLLGAAALCAFVALRPWPVTPEGTPIGPGSYVIEILQGAPPAASLSPKQSGQQAKQVAAIENGLFALIIVWATKNFINWLSALQGGFSGSDETAPAEEPTQGEPPAEEPPGEGTGVLGDLGDLGENLAEGGAG